MRGGTAPARLWPRLALIGLGVAAAAGLFAASGAGALWRERAFDALAARLVGPPPEQGIAILDIDAGSLRTVGPWPWRRDRIADLVGALAEAGPRALAVDILFAGPDRRSPAALARQLEAHLGRSLKDPARADLPDGDAALAAALARLPTLLGAALDPAGPGDLPPPSPFLIEGGLSAARLWAAPGLILPQPGLEAASAGIGVLALPADADGAARRVPLFVLADRQLQPGLALALIREAEAAPSILLSAVTGRMHLGGLALPLPADGMLRLLPGGTVPRIPAASLLAGDPEARAALAGALVFLGTSAPEAGGLRLAAGGRLVPTVALQARAAAQIRAGLAPSRPASTTWLERGAGLALILAALILARRGAPIAGAAAMLGLAALWAGGAVAAVATGLVIVDPATPAAAGLAAFLLGALAVAADARRRAARLRTAFEQHLAPAVVRRIAEQPGGLRLSGERREITALFTDIEGFSTMTETAPPEALIALLDGYFGAMAQIVVTHGGMVDKIMGDALHALFNAPVDLPDHPGRALACARALAAFASEYRARPQARSLGMGRTRIGVETGMAIVGDVGGERKLDFTAHGPAVNAAARFEQANKVFGTTVILGPGAAEQAGADLMPLGAHAIRGFSAEKQLWTLWPAGWDGPARAAWRARLAGGSPPDWREIFPEGYSAASE